MPDNLTLNITGMHCDGCVRRVTAALSSLPGVKVKSVHVGRAEVAFDPSAATPEAIAAAVSKIGFTATKES
ncbi:MAG: heavy metal-associated domain-containing protein [Acidobacteriota bacterium]